MQIKLVTFHNKQLYMVKPEVLLIYTLPGVRHVSKACYISQQTSIYGEARYFIDLHFAINKAAT
jgi:hypothetical protein